MVKKTLLDRCLNAPLRSEGYWYLAQGSMFKCPTLAVHTNALSKLWRVTFRRGITALCVALCMHWTRCWYQAHLFFNSWWNYSRFPFQELLLGPFSGLLTLSVITQTLGHTLHWCHPNCTSRKKPQVYERQSKQTDRGNKIQFYIPGSRDLQMQIHGFWADMRLGRNTGWSQISRSVTLSVVTTWQQISVLFSLRIVLSPLKDIFWKAPVLQVPMCIV